MNDITTNKIAELNDRFRKSTLSLDPVAISLGKKLMTSGIQALGLVATVEIAERVAAFDSFTQGNTPRSLLPRSSSIWRITGSRQQPGISAACRKSRRSPLSRTRALPAPRAAMSRSRKRRWSRLQRRR